MTKLIVPLDELRTMLWDGLGIEATLVDDTLNPLYLRVTGYEGSQIEFHVPIKREGMVIDSSTDLEIFYHSDHKMSHNKRNVGDKFANLDDTFSVARKIAELIG